MALVALLPEEVLAIITALVALLLELLAMVTDCARRFLDILAVIMEVVDPLLFIIYCEPVPGNPSYHHGSVGRCIMVLWAVPRIPSYHCRCGVPGNPRYCHELGGRVTRNPSDYYWIVCVVPRNPSYC